MVKAAPMKDGVNLRSVREWTHRQGQACLLRMPFPLLPLCTHQQLVSAPNADKLQFSMLGFVDVRVELRGQNRQE